MTAANETSSLTIEAALQRRGEPEIDCRVVTMYSLRSTILELLKCRKLALDTETTGLRPYHGDRLFSLILSTASQAWYFNFNVDAPDFTDDEKLDRESTFALLAPLFRQRLRTWYFFNAKFDLAMLWNEGVTDVAGNVYDGHVMARLEQNDLFPDFYSLDAVALRKLGVRKSDAAMAYILEHELYVDDVVPGKKTKVRTVYMDQVPREIIVPYGARDAVLHYRACEALRASIREQSKQRASGTAPLTNVVTNELHLTKTTFHVERQGVLVDRAYCERAIAAMESRFLSATSGFEQLTGVPYVASGKCFEKVFAGEAGIPRTPTGRLSFEAEVMETLAERHPAARLVLEARAAKSDLNYYHGFLYHCDERDYIHATLNSAGTATGRFSSSNPNLQNLSKVEGAELEAEFVVRRAIIPPPGACLVMHDMDQAEYRLMLDYAGAKKLIERVLDGLDVHQATAELAGITRTQAKNANFALLYGAGIAKLAFMLGVSMARAKEIREAVFEVAPEMRSFIRLAMQRAEERGYVTNWLGRKCRLSPLHAYKAPNQIIQGGVADIVKKGMNRARKILEGHRSYLALNVHDELDFVYYPEDFSLITTVHSALQSVYKHRYLPLTWGTDHSWKSLADKVKGLPQAA